MRRQPIASRHPVHVTLRLRPGTGYLRSHRFVMALLDVFGVARERFKMRIIHFSIQGNHLHLIVEVDDATALSRGVHGLAIRIASRTSAASARAAA